MSVQGSLPSKSQSYTLFLAFLVFSFVLCVIMFPDSAFNSSMWGITIWWQIVFPALLPFFILSELLVGTGFVHALGVLLEPLMKFLFRLPGVGGWALSVGWIAGFPAGADVVRKLREQKLLGRHQAERLLSLSHTASPFFIVHVVGIGFFDSAQLGFFIAGVHFLSAILCGILLRLYRENSEIKRGKPYPSENPRGAGLWIRSLDAMRRAQQEDGRAFGKLLSDAVYSSIQNLLLIGGYIIVFSVLLNVLILLGIPKLMGHVLSLLSPHMLRQGAEPLLLGIGELHLGTYSMGEASGIPAVWKAAVVGAMLSWSGICLHFQVHSLVGNTDLRYRTFLISRLLHASLAFGLTFLLWPPFVAVLKGNFPVVSPVFSRENLDLAGQKMSYPAFWPQFSLLALIVAVMVVLSLLIFLFRFRKT